MARPLRILYPGAWYHVMNRGAAKKNIFYSDKDRHIFLDLLERIHARYKIEIHAYCLMDNHYHLLVKTPLPNLSQAIKYLNGLYVQKINAIKQIDGPLFRSRFKSIVIEKDEYLVPLSRYIHLNPVKAGICKNPWEYKWSSCRDYLNISRKNRWLIKEEILAHFKSRESYKSFLNDKIDERDNFYKKYFPVLGVDNFVKNVAKEYIIPFPSSDEITEDKPLRQVFLPSLENVILAVCGYYSLPADDLRNSQSGKANMPRNIAIYLGIELCNQRLKQLANEFNLASGRISTIYLKIQNLLHTNNSLLKIIEEIKSNLVKSEM